MIESANVSIDTSTQHPDIESFLAQNGVQGVYKCTVYQWKADLGTYSYMGAYTSRTPDPETCVRQFGPGELKWVWSTDEKDEMTGRKKENVEFKQTFVGQHWDDMHEDYMMDQVDLREKKARLRSEKRAVDRSLNPHNDRGAADPLEDFKRMLEMTRLIQPPPPPPPNNDVLIAVIGLLGKQNTGPTMMETLLVEMIRGKNAVEVAQVGGHGQKDPEDLAMKMIGYYEKGAEMKMSREAPPPSTFSEIMDVVKEVAPAVIDFLGKVPASVRPVVANAAMSSMKDGKKFKGHMDTMKGNPDWMANAVEEWDKVYGPAQVDMFLQAGGATRPESTMGNYAKYPEKAPEAAKEEVKEATEVATEVEVVPSTVAEPA
jgi:hypothetical protein